MGSKLETLAAHPLFAGVDPDRLRECASAVVIHNVRKGTLLNGPGMARGRFHLVLRGTLRAYRVLNDGRELLLELIPEGGFDGVLSVAGRRPHFTEAQVESTVAEVDSATLERLIACDAKIGANLLDLVTDRLERRERQLEAVTLHDPDRQIAGQLLALARSFGRPRGDRVVLDSRVTHQMLGDMLGVRRETVTLHLIRLTRRGIVGVVGGRFELDVDGLAALASGRRTARRSA